MSISSSIHLVQNEALQTKAIPLLQRASTMRTLGVFLSIVSLLAIGGAMGGAAYFNPSSMDCSFFLKTLISGVGGLGMGIALRSKSYLKDSAYIAERLEKKYASKDPGELYAFHQELAVFLKHRDFSQVKMTEGELYQAWDAFIKYNKKYDSYITAGNEPWIAEEE